MKKVRTNKKLLKVLCLGLVMVMTMVFPMNAEAAGLKKARYTYVTLDGSVFSSDGIVYNYFQYPELKGKTKAVKRINKAFTSAANKHVNEDLYEPANGDTYYHTVDTKAGYNKKRVFSVRYHFEWYMGGVVNIDEYGDTFSLKTGKKLKITSVVARKYARPAKLRSVIYKKLAKKYGYEVANEFRRTYKSNKKLKKADFYVNKKGRVIVCFRTYDIAYGLMGCLTVSLPSRL